MFKLLRMVLPAALLIVLGTGCSVTRNNHREPAEFVEHLIESGVAVDSFSPLAPEPVQASSAVAISINGKDIAIYKFNQDNRVQRERMARIESSGALFLAPGFKHQAFIHGSFVILGAEKNPAKQQILEAFKTFN